MKLAYVAGPYRGSGLGIEHIRRHVEGRAIGPRGCLVFRREDLDKL